MSKLFQKLLKENITGPDHQTNYTYCEFIYKLQIILKFILNFWLVLESIGIIFLNFIIATKIIS